MIPVELLTMGASTLGGFALKYMANSQANTAFLLGKDIESRQEARGDMNGVWVRRFIVLVMMSLLAYIVVAPSLIDANAVIVDKGWLFTTTTEVKGIMYDDTIRMILTSIIGFYFGTSAASK